MASRDMQARQLMAAGMGQLSAMRLAREGRTSEALALIEGGATPFDVYQSLVQPSSGKRK